MVGPPRPNTSEETRQVCLPSLHHLAKMSIQVRKYLNTTQYVIVDAISASIPAHSIEQACSSLTTSDIVSLGHRMYN